jgi:endonuclease/exonuclease/phosphatase family metal-dependent hydrolase
LSVSLLAASYNIRKAVGGDMVRRPERILAVLAEFAPDIVVLQEADRRFGSRATALPIDLLADHGWKPVPFDSRPASIGWHGNAILAGPRIALRDRLKLEIPALEPRGAVLAEFEVSGAPVRIVGMHLDLSGLMRRRQAHAILDTIAGRQSMPTVLMGDMNEWRASAGCIADFAADHHIVLTGASFPATRPIASLDRIFLSDDIEAIDSGVHRSPLAARASDHLPVWVRLGLPLPPR